MRIRALVIVLAVVAMVASACSSTASHASLRDPAVAGAAQGQTTPPSTSQTVDQTQRLTVARVGAEAGGVVELAGRARLSIPPGALTDDAEVRLTAIGADPSAIAFPLEQPVAPAVNVQIRRAELSDAATLELLFDPDLVELPDDPILATSSQWVDIGWLLQHSSIDPDGGVVTTTSKTPNGWWRPSVWDWSRLPAVVDRAVAGHDATVPEPACTTPVPAWVQRVALGEATASPAHLCAGGFGRQLAVRMANHRPFSLAVESSQSPAWGRTDTDDQRHLRLTEIVRSAQPGFTPRLILPRLTEGAIGIDPGNFASGRIVGQATSTTMAIDVAMLVLEAVGAGASLDGWEPLLACAIPSEDGPVQPDQANEVVERLSGCARQLGGSDGLPSGYVDGVTAVLDHLQTTDRFATAVESMMATSEHMSGVLYWTDPSRVADELASPTDTAAEERTPLPLPPDAFEPSTPTPPRAEAKPEAPAPLPARSSAGSPPVTEPPTAPPATSPPPTLPPVTQPPITVAPTTAPPTTATPTTAAPTTERPRKKGSGRRNRDDDDDDD